MFERHHEPLLPRVGFLRRIVRSVAAALGLITSSLGIGVLGYHYLGELPWVDAFVNAAMILGGMGPVDLLHSNSAKIFAGLYALFSGVVFLSTAAILFAPLVHRLLHHFHRPVPPRGNDPNRPT